MEERTGKEKTGVERAGWENTGGKRPVGKDRGESTGHVYKRPGEHETKTCSKYIWSDGKIFFCTRVGENISCL